MTYTQLKEELTQQEGICYPIGFFIGGVGAMMNEKLRINQAARPGGYSYDPLSVDDGI